MFVYLITNTINGKRYVGQTTASLEQRWRFHKRLNGCRYLHAAILKYGENNFTIESICEPPTIELMNEFEAEYIRRYNTLIPNGYNLTDGGAAPRHSTDTKKRMSQSHKGLRHSNPDSYKKAWTQERREATRQRLITQWQDDELRAKRTPKKGINSCNSRLSSEQVKEIRKLWFTGEYTQTKLATMFPISQTGISKIILNHTY